MRNDLSLRKRLCELESLANGDPLVVRFVDQAGADRVGSVGDLIKSDGDFVRVVSGSSLKDVDKILLLIRKQAEVSSEGKNNV